ncbi:hypothetical protein L0Y65_01360 [Candidatus Micrarchaeota archaeon]|nr:hypothetical protein [Candidatus Micrarchaeota archaeon]
MRGSIIWVAQLLAAVIFLAGCASQQQCGTEVDYVCGEDAVTYQNPCLAAQSGVKMDYRGMCQSNATKPETLCSDSDGGKNLLIRGTSQKRGQPAMEDFCIGNGSVQENYCESGELKVETAACPAGTLCENGACIGDLCSDSDDGTDIHTKGTVRKEGGAYADICNGTVSVTEYYCGPGNAIMSASLECPAGEYCSGGACAAQPRCNESDGENDIYEKGTLATEHGAYADYCTNAAILREYRCIGEEMAAADVLCGSGFECNNGACEPVLCLDSDGGRVKGEAGTVRKGPDTYNDTCTGNASVMEYYCEEGTPAGAAMECGSDETCLSGRCVPAGCFDSDLGEVPVTSGSVTIGSLIRNDECTNLTNLKEYYCDSGDYASINVDCYSYYGGSVRAVCWMGRCAQAYCADSDGGRDENESGSASMTSATGYASDVSDYCQNNRTVVEYYCDSNWLAADKIACSDEQYCFMSKCVDSACSDSDGGLDHITAGNVTKGLRFEEDMCRNSTVLREWHCDGNTVGYEDYPCPAGCDAAGRRCVPL